LVLFSRSGVPLIPFRTSRWLLASWLMSIWVMLVNWVVFESLRV
jgi:hypothetical protein